MIPVNSAGLYSRALSSLRAFAPAAGGYRGRVVQIFLAAKYYGPAIPRVGSGSGIAVNEFQHRLDELYRKNGRADADGSIAMIFQDNHLPPTGVVGTGLAYASNIWRNNLGLQKATICYGSELELADDAFLAAPRLACPHLQHAVAGSLSDAKCGLNMEPKYRGEDGPKAIRRDPLDNGFSIVHPSKVSHWSRIIAPDGRKLPVVPLVAAIYYDADIAAGRTDLEPMDFVRDFSFSSEEYHAYFDDDPAHPVHSALLAEFPGLSWTRVPSVFGKAPPALPPGFGEPHAGPPHGPPDLDSLPVVAPRTAPPAGSHWWSAEQAVEQYLRDSGWNVINRSSQGVGFDLEVWRTDRTHRFIEVKSSVGQCAPVLTRNEYAAAKRYGSRYVLAIVENFQPDGELAILWVSDPAALPIKEREVKQYPIPRSIWLKGAGPNID